MGNEGSLRVGVGAVGAFRFNVLLLGGKVRCSWCKRANLDLGGSVQVGANACSRQPSAVARDSLGEDDCDLNITY